MRNITQCSEGKAKEESGVSALNESKISSSRPDRMASIFDYWHTYLRFVHMNINTYISL